MGLAHGGMRQKMFNAYEETLRVPADVLNPCSSAPASTPAPGVADRRAADAAALAGASPTSPAPTSRRCWRHRAADGHGFALGAPAASVQDFTRFTYDDHQAGTSRATWCRRQPRARGREPGWKYATYVDPTGARAAEHDSNDLRARPARGRQPRRRPHGRARTREAATALERLRASL